MANADAVFNTPELFEQILINVDNKTLLLSQRVNQQWQAMIQQTTSLQKKLFLKPATLAEMQELSPEYFDEDEINATLLAETDDDDKVVLLNPLLFKPDLPCKVNPKLAIDITCLSSCHHENHSSPTSTTRIPSPSYKFMSFSQPSAGKLRLEVDGKLCKRDVRVLGDGDEMWIKNSLQETVDEYDNQMLPTFPDFCVRFDKIEVMGHTFLPRDLDQENLRVKY